MAISNFSRGDALSSYNLAANGLATPYAAFNGPVQRALRPFPQYGFVGTDCCLQNVGHSTYHALIASLERRFSQGLNLQASYTWSKTITNADSLINVTNGVTFRASGGLSSGLTDADDECTPGGVDRVVGDYG